MQIRNPKQTSSLAIDCEIEHPVHGWIPFTASPDDPEKHGRDIYAAIIDAGDIAPYIAPPEPTPEELLSAERSTMIVSKFQAKAALMQADLLDATQAAIADADALTKLAWADAQEFRRNSPMIATLAAALDLTDEQVDDLFRSAAEIEA